MSHPMTPQPDLPAEVAADAMDGIRCALLNNGESLADYDTIRAHIASLERQLAEAREKVQKLALDALTADGEAATAYAAQQAAERQLAEVTARAEGDAKDAARYRWLRDPANVDGPDLVNKLGEGVLDAAIDAASAAREG